MMNKFYLKNAFDGWSDSPYVFRRRAWWWDKKLEPFRHDYHKRFLNHPVFLEALNDYMEDTERHDLTSSYWIKQFRAIDHEMYEMEQRLKSDLLAGKTKDYASWLAITREIMNERT